MSERPGVSERAGASEEPGSTPGAGRVALVTGGSRGIGAAVVHRLAADGLTVHLVYREAEEAARNVVAAVTAAGGRAVAHRADVADEKQVVDLVERIADREGALHVLVNNAAVIDDRLVAATPTAHWERVLRVNLTGPFLACREVLPLMLDQGWGRIVNISSNSVRIPGPGQSAYAAAKGGLEALTRTLAVEVGRKGIRINTVAPGKVRTEMTDAVAERLGSDGAGTRWGLPEDISGLVAFLAGEEADYIQGQTFTVDGGRLVMRAAAGARPRRAGVPA
ncbi:SDR family NAD(P)-dependent oxidoreductase [Kitasatospora purpeofusca]|uniref:SDR family NAD(P)-dependent oxidoreductase n=1 Tax=Kitasatospora purpeofusca TaxID=67352 RepID=UPI002254A353|nr:3-oxoacyl-ACP reductase family protein [Kitasatospora purpeofusca]MCX4754881.1 3-oxoacyl-ACP reductase FabG [Kitasatospora purpeofusca]WSR34266.1 3-oxoacyl-ACP reductase FabG [Kitasatospora purpeofusca]